MGRATMRQTDHRHAVYRRTVSRRDAIARRRQGEPSSRATETVTGRFSAARRCTPRRPSTDRTGKRTRTVVGSELLTTWGDDPMDRVKRSPRQMKDVIVEDGESRPGACWKTPLASVLRWCQCFVGINASGGTPGLKSLVIGASSSVNGLVIGPPRRDARRAKFLARRRPVDRSTRSLRRPVRRWCAFGGRICRRHDGGGLAHGVQ